MAHKSANILVVDWDYFFPLDRAWDWAHMESDFMINDIWPLRAATVLAEGKGLPTSLPWQGFWGRFRYAFGAKTYIADSNSLAYVAIMRELGIGVADAGIWLFDQHHDCGYKGRDSIVALTDRGTISCEDWMIPLGLLNKGPQGANLHVLYPPHETDPMDIEPTPFFENMDRRYDGEQPAGYFPDRFDMVFVCRSGAWVPSWEDDQFEAFVAASPASEVINLDGVARRPFDAEDVESLAEHIAAVVHYGEAGAR